MSNTNTGGPAFPEVRIISGDNYNAPTKVYYGGMTLRDYAAFKAMQAIFTGAVIEAITLDQDLDCDKAAKTAYTMADAMLKAREA